MTGTLTWITAAGVVGVLACKGGEAAKDEAVRATVAAKTMVIQRQSFTESLGAIGAVAARPGHVATLMAPAPGRIATVSVAPGQAVQANQVLVELDQAPFQAALQSANAAYSAADQTHQRLLRLLPEGIVARKEVEQAAADVARTHADVVTAQRALELSRLRSPIAGVVTKMTGTLGASVDPSQAIVEISDPTMLDVLLSVTPGEAARVHPGEKVSLSAGQAGGGDALGVGTVTDLSSTIDTATRSVTVRVRVPASRRPMRIGETVFGAIAVSSHPAAIVVPLEALVPEGDAFHVFVVDANGMAHERDVKVGGKTATSAEIVEGLAAGERVVTFGAYAVQDSAKIVPPTTEGDSAKPTKP
ncbi:MAG: efflux RND transporter periplasmic adaptor subunit [Gemmatimonadaceae bacterium]